MSVAANAGVKNDCTVYNPVEFVFPGENRFKTYKLKTSELHGDANVPCGDEELSSKLKEAASKIFTAFNGAGYARLDFRVREDGAIFFLEINFTCSVFYEDGYEGSADYILTNDPAEKKAFSISLLMREYSDISKSKENFL